MPNTFLKQRIRHGRVAGFGHGEVLSASRPVTATFTSNPLRVTLASVAAAPALTSDPAGVACTQSCVGHDEPSSLRAKFAIRPVAKNFWCRPPRLSLG